MYRYVYSIFTIRTNTFPYFWTAILAVEIRDGRSISGRALRRIMKESSVPKWNGRVESGSRRGKDMLELEEGWIWKGFEPQRNART